MTSTRQPGALVVVGALILGIPAALAGEQAVGEPPPGTAQPHSQRVATVPFTMDHNRLIAEVELVRPDGTIREASAWVDTGSEVLIVTEPVARELGLDLSGLDAEETIRHTVAITSPAPGLRIGGLPLDVEGIATRVKRGAWIMPGVPAEVQLPASALRHDQVVLDYPALRLTVARPALLQPRGVAIPCHVNPSTGLVMISATVDGEPVQLGLDTGSAGTWVSTALTHAWQARHPEWRHVIGALGSTNFWGKEFETGGVLMRLPELAIGSVQVRDVALLGIDQELFDWYSRKSAGPVAGILGANVLKRFRLEIDFANRLTYWEPGPEANDHDLDIIGLTVRAEDSGGFTVASVVSIDGRPAVAGVEAGDRLVRVGSFEVAGATMGEVIEALRGEPRATRTLEVERGDRRITVQAEILRFP